ncbi:hypothetical protein AMECASPLE_015088, partial [Ameca splendens]
HIENWTGLQTLRDVDMELYTGIQRLTIMNCNLRVIQPRAFAQNPHLRYILRSVVGLVALRGRYRFAVEREHGEFFYFNKEDQLQQRYAQYHLKKFTQAHFS